jgi:prevent-host-death family protein
MCNSLGVEMPAVKSSDFQKNVGYWLDQLSEGPVRITKYDRDAAVLVSAKEYEELRANYRRVIAADQLTEAEVDLIRASRSSAPFTLDNLPEVNHREPSGT